MNKKLFIMMVVGTLSACSQANNSVAAPKSHTQEEVQVQQVEQKAVETQITHLNANEAFETIKARPDLVIIDVRTPGEFAGGHIDGAINIDFRNANFASHISKLDGSKEYLIHCRSGGRSTRSLTTFKDAGFSHILHMDGGMIGWNKSGLPTVK